MDGNKNNGGPPFIKHTRDTMLPHLKIFFTLKLKKYDRNSNNR